MSKKPLEMNEDQPQEPLFNQQCAWTTQELLTKKRVTFADFATKFAPHYKDKKEEADTQAWSRVRHAVFAVLNTTGQAAVEETGDQPKGLMMRGKWGQPRRYETEYFRPYDDLEQKETIGELVAEYLKKRQNRHVLLGSGSTVYHVGQKMRKFAPYNQMFWSVNVPLLADWCESENRPVDEIHVPEGILKTKTFRYASMQAPPWHAPIVVVGADGVYYNKATDTARLYANEGAVAVNTNLFLETATDTVICCLASTKLKFAEGEGQNCGPWINERLDVPRKYLFTDTVPDEGKVLVKALKKNGWTIVTKQDGIPTE